MKNVFALIIVLSVLLVGVGNAFAQRTFLGLPYCQSQPTDMLRDSNHLYEDDVVESTCASRPVGTFELALADFGSINGCYYDNAANLSWNDCHVTCFTPNPNIQWELYYMHQSGDYAVWNWRAYFFDEPGTDGRSYCYASSYLVILN
jgi:hypothetical protein